MTVAIVATVLLVAGCGDDGGTGTDAGGKSHDGGAGHPADSDDLAFGKPGSGDPDRTITVAGTDELRFDPDQIEVKVGETIAFEFVNEGKGLHEFVLGDQASMDAHGDAHGGSVPYATPQVRGGDESVLTWEFTEAGEFLYECHVDSHDEEGMRGTITVSE